MMHNHSGSLEAVRTLQQQYLHIVDLGVHVQCTYVQRGA